MRITVAAARVRPNLARRQLAGTLFRYGEVGHTDAGPLRIDDPQALEWPDDLTSIPLTLEHDRGTVRGHLALVDDNDERVYIVAQVDDGPEGDDALAEAADRSSRGRAAFSYQLEDADVRDGAIIAGRVVAIGQVRDPAYNSARIDQIAAARTPGEPGHTEGEVMTEEQRRRLEELRAQQTLTAEERAELEQLVLLEAADSAEEDGEGDEGEEESGDSEGEAGGQQVAAARRRPAVPSGVPGRRTPARTRPRGQGLEQFISTIVAALSPGGGGARAISAALADVTQTGVGVTIEAPAWSGELWSGVQYEPEFTPLLNSGTLTNWEGNGWRWGTKPQMADYAGDKAAIPSNAVTVEPSGYEAARMAAGWDLDRKFYDFPNAAFLQSFFEAAREDWAYKLDKKVEAYISTEGQTNVSGVAPVAGKTLSSIGRLLRYVKRQRLGRATFVILSDTDYDNLLDYTDDSLPAFLEMFGIDPKQFTSSATVPADLVVAGVKQAATVRTLPGSPLRVDAQNIANGGVDSGLFGYWAIEEHHDTGIVSMDLGNVA